jgi:hypothetical protein
VKSPATKAARPRRARVHDAAGPVPRVDARESAAPVSIVSRSAAYMEPADPQGRLAMIAEAAFYLAERRRFDPGHELDDWLQAERSVDCLLQSGQPQPEQTP